MSLCVSRPFAPIEIVLRGGVFRTTAHSVQEVDHWHPPEVRPADNRAARVALQETADAENVNEYT